MVCIYKITNTRNGRVYIGSTANFAKRCSEHKSGIKNRTHENKHIKNDSYLYMLDDFVFEVISEYVGIKTIWLRLLEKIWIDAMKYHFNLYNINHNTLGFGVVYCFPTKQERFEYRKIAKLEKRKSVEYAKELLAKDMIACIEQDLVIPF